MNNYYIFTEIFGCSKVGKIAIESFLKYHNIRIHIMGTADDFKDIEVDKKIFRVFFDDKIKEKFKEGHLGTATLWARLIKELPPEIKYLIHFDSDIIFRDEILSKILGKINEGYDLIGARRCYKNNPINDNSVRNLEDVCATGFFAFNREKISKWDMDTLVKMCRGTYNPLGHPVLDFFDPIMFDMLKNGAKIFFLNPDEVGGSNEFGSRDNKYKEYNNGNTPFKIEFGSKLSHFSAVGSGMNFYNNPNIDVPESYKKYAIDRYALFCKIFYNEDLGIDLSQYKNLLEIKNWF